MSAGVTLEGLVNLNRAIHFAEVAPSQKWFRVMKGGTQHGRIVTGAEIALDFLPNAYVADHLAMLVNIREGAKQA